MFGKQKRQERKRQERAQLEAQQKAKRHDRLIALLEQAERFEFASNELPRLDAWDETIGAWYEDLLNEDERARWKKAEDQLAAQDSYPDELQRLREAFAAYQAKTGLVPQINALIELVRSYIQSDELNYGRLAKAVGISRDEAFGLLTEAVQTRYEQLAAARGSMEGLLELWDFIRRSRGESFHDSHGNWLVNDLNIVGVKALPYPDNWNELVAGYYNTPTLSMFDGQPERGSGSVRLLAAVAITNDDFTKAQIALAYCNHDPKFRTAVGDVLTAELAKLVVRHRSEVTQSADSAKE